MLPEKRRGEAIFAQEQSKPRTSVRIPASERRKQCTYMIDLFSLEGEK